MAKRYFPAFLDLEGQVCVVVGGGRIAADKIDGLLQAGGQVTVVAPRVSHRIADWSQNGVLQLVRREYREGDLAGAVLAVAATGDPDINRQVYDEGKQRRLLVNVVDSPAQCNYITPSVVRRGQLLVAISTQGTAPALAAAIRRYLERRLDPCITAFLEQASMWRHRLKREEPSVAIRRARWHRLIGRVAPSLLGIGPPTALETPRSPLSEARGESFRALRPGKTADLGSVGVDLLAARVVDVEACQAALAHEERVNQQLAGLRHSDGTPLLDGWAVVAEGERAEVFYQTRHPRLARRILRTWFERELQPARLPWQPEGFSGVQAIEHLFRVACGLHAVVPMQTAVCGVLRRALLRAGMNNTLPVPLERAFRTALSLAKRVCSRGSEEVIAPEPLQALIRLAAARMPQFADCWFAIIMEMPWADVAKRMLMAEGASTSRILMLDAVCRGQLVNDALAGKGEKGQRPAGHLLVLADGCKGTPRVSRELLRVLLSRGVSRLWAIDAGIPRTISAEAGALHGVTVWNVADLIDQDALNETHHAAIAAVGSRISQLAAEYHNRYLVHHDDLCGMTPGVEPASRQFCRTVKNGGAPQSYGSMPCYNTGGRK